MSDLENTISHPRQCAGCEKLMTKDDDVIDINAMNYACRMGEDSKFIVDCKKNTAYDTGYHEGDYPKSEKGQRQKIANDVIKYWKQGKGQKVKVYTKKDTIYKMSPYSGYIYRHNLAKGFFFFTKFGVEHKFKLCDIVKIKQDHSWPQ